MTVYVLIKNDEENCVINAEVFSKKISAIKFVTNFYKEIYEDPNDKFFIELKDALNNHSNFYDEISKTEWILMKKSLM